jgi:hypothetical protein
MREVDYKNRASELQKMPKGMEHPRRRNAMTIPPETIRELTVEEMRKRKHNMRDMSGDWLMKIPTDEYRWLLDAAEKSERYEAALYLLGPAATSYLEAIDKRMEWYAVDAMRDFLLSALAEFRKAISTEPQQKEEMMIRTDDPFNEKKDTGMQGLPAYNTAPMCERCNGHGRLYHPIEDSIECPHCENGIAPKGGHEGSTRYVCLDCNGTGRKL